MAMPIGRTRLPMKRRRSVWMFLIPAFLVAVLGGVLLLSVPRDSGPTPAPEETIVVPPPTLETPEPGDVPAGEAGSTPELVIADPIDETPADKKDEEKSVEAESSGQLTLPDGFPERHINHKLQQVTEEEIMAGVASYFVAEYGRGEGEEETKIFVRLVGLEKEASDGFLDLMLDAMAGNSTMEKIDVLVPEEGTGWERAGLYQRREAGVYYSANDRALVIIAAPSPAEARTFGEALKAP
jgi:hypothetical protein